MNDLLILLKERLQLNEPLVLVTITKSSGSTPRGEGARMLVGALKGANEAAESSAHPVRLWGSIGGGITEHLAIEEAGKLLQNRGVEEKAIESKNLEPKSACIEQKKYKLHPGEAADLGLRCGGEIAVSFRFIPAGDTELIAEIEREIVSVGIVYVFGGGHVAQELVPLLARLYFRCIVFEDREEFARKELFPGAEKIILGDFNHIENSVTLGKNDYAVVLTRGHLFDLEAWAFALKSDADYIGVIGSKSKHEFVKGQLLGRGFTSDIINAARVHAPIGIKINSETPAEIAVSIAAELIQFRALK